MKKQLYAFAIAVFAICAGSTSESAAQGGVYFREGFENSTGWPTTAATAVTLASPANTFVEVNTTTSGKWYTFGAYSTSGATGACPTQTGGSYHVRFANQTAISGYTAADSSYLITPLADAGIFNLTYLNGRANRRITVFKTADSDPATTNWVQIFQSTATNLACEAFTIPVNDANAKRLRIVARSGTDSDLDSMVMTSIGALPAKLGSLNLESKNNSVRVIWTAYNELNVRGYSIERSIDGVNFNEVGFQGAKNASFANYSFSDLLSANGVIFYRIRIFDFDGKSQVGSIARIQVGGSAAAGINIINPVRGKRLEMQLTGMKAGSYRIAVNAADGSMVASRMVSVQGTVVSSTLELPQSIGKGLYTVTVSGTGFHQARRVIVE